MRWVKIPGWIQYLFPELVWKLPDTEKIIYFTFDDGPTPEVTPRVLDLLFQYQVKATFFCTGWKAEKYPELMESIRNAGHVVANHGYEHTDGFFSKNKSFLLNAEKGAKITNSNLFRPPYGRITPSQVKLLKPRFSIIQWTVMSMDFDPGHSVEDCYKNVADHSLPGTIVVFHDTVQAENRLLPLLPQLLTFFLRNSYQFRSLKNFNHL